MTAVMITVEQFNELRKMSIEVLELIKLNSTAAQGRCGDLVNTLIDIEDRYIDATRPLGPTENVGSCEAGPLIRWDKTGAVWHTDTKAGRYSVRRVAKRMPFAAYLNGNRITNVPEGRVDVVKRDVEHRIIAARRIAQQAIEQA